MSRLFRIFSLLFLLCLYFYTEAQYFEIDGIAYNVLSTTEHTVEVASKSCNFYQGNINIPATVTYDGTTYDVVALGERAFYGGTLSSVTIPSSVTHIKRRCFLFATGPTSVIIPASVTNIDPLAFAAYNMTAIYVAANNPNYVSIDGILFNKDTSTVVECPMGKNGTITLPQSTRNIATSAFAYCQTITKVILPEGLTDIGKSAFIYNNRLNNLVIPASVSHIGTNLFAGCSNLNNLSIAEGNTHYFMDGNAIYTSDSATIISCHKSADSVFLPSTLRVVSGFNNNTNIKYIHVPEGVTTISDNAFGNSSLQSIDLPSHLHFIDEWAFYNCTSLTQVSMPTTLDTIGAGCFSRCTRLTSIEIPNGLRTITSESFNGCTSLSHITWGNAIEVIDTAAFGGCIFAELQFPATLKSIRMGGFSAYNNVSWINSVVFNASVDTIEPEAFTLRHINTLRFKNNVTPVTVTMPEYGADYGCLYMAYVDSIIIPCGSMSAWLADSYWRQFIGKYHEDCNSIEDVRHDDINISAHGNLITIRGAQGESVCIYDALGRQIHHIANSTEEETFKVPSASVYIIKVGDNPAKKIATL